MKFERVALFGFSPEDLRAPPGAELERELRLRANAVVVAASVEALADADALVLALGQAADRSLFERARNLEYVGIFGTDQGRVDVEAARARGIVVRNVPGYSTDSVAEFAVATLLERFRRLDDAKARARKRDLADGPGGTTLRGKRLGVLGLGRIGQRVAEIARRGFDAEVIYWSRTRRPEIERSLGIVWRDSPALAVDADAVAVHLPLTPATSGLFGRQVFESVRAGAVWVHLSPLELVVLEALEAGLASGRFEFVFDHADELEPAWLERLVRYPGAVPYPPVACTTDTARARKLRLFLDDVDAFLAGGETAGGR